MKTNKDNNYKCYVNENYSEEFLHPVLTFIFGTIINFRYLIYIGAWYIVIFSPLLDKPLELLPPVLAGALIIFLLSYCVYCIIFKIIGGIIKEISFWYKVFKTKRKLPLMTLGYFKAKTLIRNLDEFTCGRISIRRLTLYGEGDSYYGITNFLGFYQDNYTCFKGSVFAIIMLVYSVWTNEAKGKIIRKLEKYQLISKLKKEKKYTFNKELNMNQQKAINSLLKEIEKKKAKSEKLINQATDEMRDVFRD